VGGSGNAQTRTTARSYSSAENGNHPAAAHLVAAKPCKVSCVHHGRHDKYRRLDEEVQHITVAARLGNCLRLSASGCSQCLHSFTHNPTCRYVNTHKHARSQTQGRTQTTCTSLPTQTRTKVHIQTRTGVHIQTRTRVHTQTDKGCTHKHAQGCTHRHVPKCTHKQIKGEHTNTHKGAHIRHAPACTRKQIQGAHTKPHNGAHTGTHQGAHTNIHKGVHKGPHRQAGANVSSTHLHLEICMPHSHGQHPAVQLCGVLDRNVYDALRVAWGCVWRAAVSGC